MTKKKDIQNPRRFRNAMHFIDDLLMSFFGKVVNGF